MRKVSTDHERPISPEAFRRKLREAKPGTIGLAKGQYSPDPARVNRYFIFTMEENSVVPLFDCWISENDYGKALALVRTEREVFTGACDAMYATKAAYVWIKQEEKLLLFHKNRLSSEFGAEGVQLIGKKGQKWIETLEIRDIYLFLSEAWVECGVRLRLKNGTDMEIAKNKEWSAVFDPTYDGIDLMGDTFWAIDLGRAIQKYLDAPLNMDKDLE